VNRKQRRANNKSQPTRPLAELFARAAQSHREGRLEEAGQLYRQVLAGDPRHADSLHRLGVIAYQKGRFAESEALLQKAIAQNAKIAAYHSHLSLALDAQGRLDEAVACCRTAIAQDPALADVHNNLGVLLMRLGRPGEALASYRKALNIATALARARPNDTAHRTRVNLVDGERKPRTGIPWSTRAVVGDLPQPVAGERRRLW